jgi:hypothetical protein
VNFKNDKKSITKKFLSEAYGLQIENEAKNFFEKYNDGKFTDFPSYLSGKCYFVTMMFDWKKIDSLKRHMGLASTDDSIEFHLAYRFYKWVVEEIYGRHATTRKRTKSPLPMITIGSDFEGSRYSADATNAGRNVHLHAVWFLGPNNSDKFQDILDKFNPENSIKLDFWMTDIRFDKYDGSRGTLKNMINYTLKGERLKSADDSTMSGTVSYQQYPNDLTYHSNPELIHLKSVPMGNSKEAKLLLDAIEADKKKNAHAGFTY